MHKYIRKPNFYTLVHKSVSEMVMAFMRDGRKFILCDVRILALELKVSFFRPTLSRHKIHKSKYCIMEMSVQLPQYYRMTHFILSLEKHK